MGFCEITKLWFDKIYNRIKKFNIKIVTRQKFRRNLLDLKCCYGYFVKDNSMLANSVTGVQLDLFKITSLRFFLSSLPDAKLNLLSYLTLCGRWVELVHRFLVCYTRRLKGCPDGSAFMAWDYASLLCNLYSLGWRELDTDPKCCH